MAEKNMDAKISVEFEETANRQQLSSGDNLPTLFGKIKKIISDLSTSAFSGSYNDLSDKPEIPTIAVDTELSDTSENAVQNKIIANALKNVDAKTVNGLMVETAVPANAKFTDTVYDDTAVKAHIVDTNVHITADERTKWNAKSDFSGSYSDLSNAPTSLPANGGNADTVNTQYQAPITTDGTLLYPTFVDSNNNIAEPETIKTNDSVQVKMKAGTTSTTGIAQFVIGSTKQAGTEGNMQGQLAFFGPHHPYWAILAQNTGQTGNAGYFLPTTGGTLALDKVATASVNGLMSTGTQTFAGAKTFNGVVKVAGATDSAVSQVRNIAVGTATVTTTLCPNGALYGQYS